MTITLYHNPRCSKSRQTLALLEEQGIAPSIREYLIDVPNADELREILNMLGFSPRDLMRKKESEYKENNLGNVSLSDDDLIEAMINFPKLIERPIVINNGKAAIGRPPEAILEII
ncbi:MAG: arsenate reductase (glutaredoxin) [Kordiimonadaceae bacterium]|jgi:arsenate reductase (glutaredoxin)|nr:arsenate reductase (glutaredoxin) [Kordiimonadaceae bacterium]MBT6032860.1 arsenate reductase (glutaredoxin) [Kordiimonadaceae bacterium]